MRKAIVMGMMIPFLFTGCIGKLVNIGEEQGYCEEHGCDYSDAGVCGDVYQLFKQKKKVAAVAYKNIECDCAGEFDVKK